MISGELSNLAIVVLNYNNSRLTIYAAESLLKLNIGLHVIVVDNFSNDNSRSELYDALMNRENIHLILNDKNFGYAHGNNIGIKFAEKLGFIEYVGIMNPDVLIDAVTLMALVDRLQDDRIGFITSKVCYNGRFNIPNECAWHLPTLMDLLAFCTLIGYVQMHFLARLGFKNNVQGYYSQEHYCDDIAIVDSVQGCFFMGKLSTFLAIGNLDENTFLYYEENILAAKVKRINKYNAVLTKYHIYHNHQEKDKSMIKRANKVFDMTCLHNSRDYYIKAYQKSSILLKYLLRFVLNMDFYLRKAVVLITFKE